MKKKKQATPETVVVMHADGTDETVPYPEDLKGWQKLVGGYIEIAYPQTKPPCVLVVNEEGLLARLPQNVRACAAFDMLLVGDVVHVTGPALKRWKKDA